MKIFLNVSTGRSRQRGSGAYAPGIVIELSTERQKPYNPKNEEFMFS
jgi:hypothetical protein